MSIFEPAPSPWPERMLAIFRIVAAAIFITSGTLKLFGWPPPPMQMPPIPFLSQIWIGAAMEVAGGALILIGWLTRPVSFILAGEMAVAYFQFHAQQSFYPTTNQGIPAILYCFLFLYLMVAGAGAWSVDGTIAAKRRE
ncbi:MAG TPA: DoxX family protein [Thermoanaerobaculia bacterium]|nr:DoxX family protein [Thermoanaerobaculia bacterium]